jgi:hypothetical protein
MTANIMPFTLSKRFFCSKVVVFSINNFMRPYLSIFGLFKATHGYKFSTANHFLKLPHLRKVAVMAATWQPWSSNYFAEFIIKNGEILGKEQESKKVFL